jgi:ABC-type amino acid transport substrate-binding protein
VNWFSLSPTRLLWLAVSCCLLSVHVYSYGITLYLEPAFVRAFEKADEVVAAYDAGRCDTYTTDKSGLAAQRTKMQNPDDHIVLPETISETVYLLVQTQVLLLS